MQSRGGEYLGTYNMSGQCCHIMNGNGINTCGVTVIVLRMVE
jgi:hypothetical protein